MTEEEVSRIAAEAADRAARKAIRETLLALGVDADRPIEFQEKMQFLASARAVMRTIVSQAITAIVGIAAVGGATAIWMQMGQPK
jgi:ABC-type uncharacterized transport system substrate-binding protein